MKNYSTHCRLLISNKKRKNLNNESKMQAKHILMIVVVTFWPALAKENTVTSLPQIESGTNDDEYDSESARKIIGSR